MKKKYKIIKKSEIAGIRAELLKKQNHICPLCGEHIQTEDAVVDHSHYKGMTGGNGLIRAILHRNCNVMEGRISNTRQRSGIKLEDLPNFLRNLAKYLEKDQNKGFTDIVHPSENKHFVKKEKLTIPFYKKMIKFQGYLYPRRTTIPEYKRYPTKVLRQYIVDYTELLNEIDNGSIIIMKKTHVNKINQATGANEPAPPCMIADVKNGWLTLYKKHVLNLTCEISTRPVSPPQGRHFSRKRRK